jgi:hypothetical protein
MRVASWIFTIAALVMIGACFFNDGLIFFAFILAVLAAWADDWAIDIELRNFLESKK